MLLILAACAVPEERGDAVPPDMPPAFRLADEDRDGVVTAAEWEQRIDSLFDQLDEDDSGFVEFQELRRQFDDLDQDDDGRIEVEEAGALAATADQDGDGALSESEYQVVDWPATGIDANLDGRISRSEFRRAQRRTFEDFDRDRDRQLRAGEIEDRARFTIFRF